MNTQTHILLACTLLVPAVVHPSVTKTPGSRALAIAAIIGALVPDASIFVMWGIAKIQSVPESIIWQQWYYADFWQQMGAISNSLPIFLLFAVIGWLAGGRWYGASQRGRYWPTLLLVAAGAATLHVVADLPLHHDDGHPHFWPISDWIYRSPVSYWDPAHYGQVWSVIEMLLAIVLVVILWRRFEHRLTRGLLVLVASSYLLMMGYWFLAMS